MKRAKPIAAALTVAAAAGLTACRSGSSSSPPASAVRATAQAAGGAVADCEGAFIADVGAGAARLQDDENSVLTGGVPACAPVLHLRKVSGGSLVTDCTDRVWAQSKPWNGEET
jgi:hypothetical protein